MTVRSEILRFLREPVAFADDVPASSRELWAKGLSDWVEPLIARAGDYPLRPSQVRAWHGLADHRAALILGPPGTGKTYALSWMALGYLQACRAERRPCRVLVTAFTLNAVGNLLEAVADKVGRYLPGEVPVVYFGNEPAAGLHPGIELIALREKGARARVWETLDQPYLVAGCSVWALSRILGWAGPSRGDGSTAEIFDLVCIDEASQMVVSNGLMALAGLVVGGRVLVAGDDKQLPPVRQIHDQEVDGRRLGGSLYTFMKSACLAEFALDETFRLNAPLTRFPETRFYPGRYRSAADVAGARLALPSDWQDGLEPWERLVLDPAAPIAILLHEGPTAGTSNPFEAKIAARLVKRFHALLPASPTTSGADANSFWQRRLAVVSPHRAQNAAIRAALAGHPAADGAVVETVDRIQGKERDAIIASYTVSDPEFALAEAEFIFSPERLNVTITRARTKLVLLVSRRLLDVVPAGDEVLDAAQILRELVYDSTEVGVTQLQDNDGRLVPVSLRVRGFAEDELPRLESTPDAQPDEPLPELTPELAETLEAIRRIALASPYGNATLPALRKALFRDVPFRDLRALLQRGEILLGLLTGPHSAFWVATPQPVPRPPFAARLEVVRERLEDVIDGVRKSVHPPFYKPVRNRFVWVDEHETDILMPTLQDLAGQGLVRLERKSDSVTVEWLGESQASDTQSQSAISAGAAPEPLTDNDYVVLNRLEELDAKRIDLGIFEAWSSPPELARALGLARGEITDALRRLAGQGHLLLDDAGRVRSRMAELARELRYVKQRFDVGDAHRRPYLIRALKVELKTREKPIRDEPLDKVLGEIREALAEDLTASRVLDGLGEMLRRSWKDPNPLLAGFQARAIHSIFTAWRGRDAANSFVISADTGSGKTEAAGLPLIAGAACDVLEGLRGVRAILVYPRIRLAANQAQRLAGYLAALATVEGMPTLTLGLQNAQVPARLDAIEDYLQGFWGRADGGCLGFPFFACPACAAELELIPRGGLNGVDLLRCHCGWRFAGWVGSKSGLCANPPQFFLPVTESLHQWQQDDRYGVLFGDRDGVAPPRVLLADEIHLYSHVHGAQVGYTFRRLLARAALNESTAPPPLAIGMSATLGDPARVWRELCGRDAVKLLRPEPAERQENPKGREYFYFVQPEVESRGKDIAGASATIQALMCLSHGMRRRTGRDGGYRGIVFLDSIDKLKRLHGDYQDAEEGKHLAALRTRRYDDDPITGEPRRACCGEPAGCDRFREGECWYFAARDAAQCTASGSYRPGRALRVAGSPVYSGTGGRVERMIRDADIVFATSSLEVGYDDPEMILVYQHYAPNNLASFIQRKGRGGRGADDRPVTGVTLSPYSPRDSWYFRRPSRMLDEGRFAVPLNMSNHFVRLGQVLSVVLDTLARLAGRGETLVSLLPVPVSVPASSEQPAIALAPRALASADAAIRGMFGETIYRELGHTGLAELWAFALAQAEPPIQPGAWISKLRDALPWVPKTLFGGANLPQVEIRHQRDAAAGKGREGAVLDDITLAWDAATPGSPTRRYGSSLLHWVPPRNGASEWFPRDVYVDSVGFALPVLDQGGVAALLRELPLDARSEIGDDPHPKVCLLKAVQLETAGEMRGGWTPHWYFDPNTQTVKPIDNQAPANPLKVYHKSRGSLREAVLVEAESGVGQVRTLPGFDWLADGLAVYTGGSGSGKPFGGDPEGTGLAVTRLVWGADAELRLDDQRQEPIPFTQTFIHPTTRKTLLHGYRLDAEGVQLDLNSARLTDFVRASVERLRDSPAGRWHLGQFLRYLIGARSKAVGLNGYEAERAADLLFSAEGHPQLREQLNRLARRWDSPRLAKLLTDTFQQMLAYHPLLTQRRVERLAVALGGRQFQQVFKDCLGLIGSDDAFAGYLRSTLINSLAVRLGQAFVLHGKGDERQVIVHLKTPLDYGDHATDRITVAEHGIHGDGTTRLFIENLHQVLDDWTSGGLTDCPNAREDSLLDAVLLRTDRHDAWRRLDPRDPAQMIGLADEIGCQAEDDRAAMQGALRILYGTETLGADRLENYGLAREIRCVRCDLEAQMQRESTTWELASAAVLAAAGARPDIPNLVRLLNGYRSLEDAGQEESLSPQARLADQVYRLGARLCVDGCPGCLHAQAGGSIAEATTSRRLLEQFVSTAD